MELIRGRKYSYTPSKGNNELIYSHSDEVGHNHFFTVAKNERGLVLDELGQISLPTWDVFRNVKLLDQNQEQ